jgi:peptidoglycan/LPS O-acetylase OafA/YrhL
MHKQHVPYFDFIRGIAILMVVAIHTYANGNFENTDGIAKILFRQLLNCAVPIFLALSGFFLGRKTFDNKYGIISFWKKQIPKVYIPCIIWSLPWSILVISSGVSIEMQLIKIFLCAVSIYYFIALIIQYYLLLPFLQKHPKRNLVISIIISTISILIITYLNYIKGLSIPLIIYAGPFVVWFVFYMLGVYYSQKNKNYSLKLSIAIILIGFFLECLETYYLNTYFTNGIGIKLSAFIYSYGTILLILHPRIQASYRQNTFNSIIVYIGKISFGIYLTHCYVIFFIGLIKLTTTSWFFNWLIVSLITIGLISIARTIFPKKINKYIGLS